MMEEFISVVTPVIQDNIKDRNERLGPDVRLRTNSQTVLAEAFRQIPTTIAQATLPTAQPQQTRTSLRLQQIQTQIRQLQQQQQDLQTARFAEQTGLSAGDRPASVGLGLDNGSSSWQAQLPSRTTSWAVSGFGGSAPAPPLDKKIMETIQRGEYVNFNLILSSTSYEISLTEDNDDEAPFSISMNRDERGRS